MSRLLVVLLFAMALLPRPVTAAPRDDLQALQSLAARGDAPAAFKIGLLYHFGAGIAKDEAQAAAWYRKAADAGLPDAQFELAELSYRYGFGGRKDDAVALKWFRAAVDHGHKYARYELSEMYEKGYGLAQDDAQAYFWEVAAGDIYVHEDVERRLGSAKAADIHKNAVTWRGNHPLAKPVEVDWLSLGRAKRSGP
jgi:uncharacterized protein